MTDSKSRYKKLFGSFKSPIQLTALIGTVSAIVGFIILFKGNFYLTSIVIIILALAWLLRFCIKLAFSKTEPLVVGGKGVYEYRTERPYALSGVILIPLLMMSGFVYLFTQGKPIVSQAIFGTFTPSPTNTLPPTMTPTLTATLTPVPDAYSLYYLFILDASSRMLANFNESETKWQDLQASALNHLIYGLPDRANYGLIVLGGNLVNSTGTCDNPNQEVVTLGLNMKTTLIETIKNVQPYGVASLADAITLARDIFERQQGDVHRKLMLFLGGGDECADDKWMALKYFLKDYQKSELIDVFTEVVVLPDETIDPVVFTDLQTEITRLGIENEVAINAPKDNQELQAVLGNIYSQSMDQARQYEPAAVADPTHW